jgi:hypothetical protein
VREAFVRDLLDLKGASERVYRFMLVREGRALSPMGGNYLYAVMDGDSLKILYAAEAQNLLSSARDRWGEAVQMYGPAQIYMRLNISERIRKMEHDDLLAALKPPMNVSEEAKKAG